METGTSAAVGNTGEDGEKYSPSSDEEEAGKQKFVAGPTQPEVVALTAAPALVATYDATTYGDLPTDLPVTSRLQSSLFCCCSCGDNLNCKLWTCNNGLCKDICCCSADVDNLSSCCDKMCCACRELNCEMLGEGLAKVGSCCCSLCNKIEFDERTAECVCSIITCLCCFGVLGCLQACSN